MKLVPVSKKRLFILIIFILVLAVLLIWWLVGRVEVEAFSVLRQDAIKGVTVTGTVESREDVALAPIITGKVQKILFGEGSFVNRGQTLVFLDREEIQGNVIAAEGQLQTARAQVRNLETEPRVEQAAIASAQVREAQANIDVLNQNLDQAQVQLQEAQIEERRLSGLYQLGAVSYREFEQATFASAQAREYVEGIQDQFEVAQSRLTQARENYSLVLAGTKTELITAAKGQVTTARGNIQSAVGRLDNYILKAPVTGYIVEKILDTGEVASPTVPVLRLVKPEDLYVSAQVEENEIKAVETGQTAYIIYDAYPGQTFIGKVIQISKNVDPVTGTFEAKITASGRSGIPVLVGMTTDATIVTAKFKNIIIIPKDYVYTQNGMRYVYRKIGNKAQKTYITGNMFDNNRVRVVKGLNKGDIIVKGQGTKKVKQGDRVKITDYYKG